jgi:hypothetical protein
MAMATDRSAIAAAVQTCGQADPGAVTLVRMRNTLDLEHLLVSESLRTAVDADADLEITGDAVPMTFDEKGRLLPWE